MIALIDADTIIYIIGWHFREQMEEPSAIVDAERATDDFVKTILTLIQADEYLGTFSSSKCFRNDLYKVAPYKGTRPEKADWIKYWQPIIKKRLIEKWNFYQPKEIYSKIENAEILNSYGIEADDIIAAMVDIYGTQNCVICSPDKDLKQIPGIHYDYKKENAVPEWVLPIDAQRNFTVQMLCGDTTDSILGVPGLGPVKVKKLLDDCNDPIEWGTIIMQQYCKYYGQYYGPIIYRETIIAVQLLCKKHPLWHDYQPILEDISKNYRMPFSPVENTISIFGEGEE